MTEKEKRDAGELYNPMDAELMAERNAARTIWQELGTLLLPETDDKRVALLKRLLGKTGKNVWAEPFFRCDYGYHITVGENFYANFDCIMLDEAPITIGDDVLLAPRVGIYTAGHPLEIEPRRMGLEYAKPVTLGNRVWVGADCSILPGVTIGEDTVIAAGSTVTRDIPAGVLAAGNPCRVIRTLQA